MDWEFIIDTAQATVIASLVALIGILIANWFSNRKGYKDIDVKMGDLRDTTLSKQHSEISEKILNDNQIKQTELNSKIGDLSNTTLSGQNLNILNEVKSIRSDISTTQKEEYSKRQHLTGEQFKIEQSITTLSTFSQIMMELQSRNVVLEQDNRMLQQQNDQLKQEVADLQEQLNQNEDFENTLNLG